MDNIYSFRIQFRMEIFETLWNGNPINNSLNNYYSTYKHN